MNIDKSWIDSARTAPDHLRGLESFIEMCQGLVDSQGKVRCLCLKYKNFGLISPRKMKFHLYSFGFWRDYTKWVYHGETSMPPVVVVDDVPSQNDMDDVIEDLGGSV